ncbi:MULTISPECIES: DUF6302 family protein [Streptomyces]|uniref:DUF6302 family protein n=1 Tax=Streptomyces TaxID=1883 RepID=UPI001C0F0932|nr:DUF6302 family protein [Streptomyces kasugaensis]
MTSSVDLLPAEHAYDFDYFSVRLENHQLLHSSVAVRVFRAPLLAVPVGGRRRGGYFSASEVSIGLAIRNALAGTPGFPNTKLRRALFPDCCHVVEWGETPPDTESDVALGRFYGYSERAIAAHVHQNLSPTRPRRSHIDAFGLSRDQRGKNGRS